MHLFELLLLFFSVDNLVLHFDLLIKVLLLKFSELANAHESLLVPRKSFAHRQLVLVLKRRLGRAIAVPIIILDAYLADS